MFDFSLIHNLHSNYYNTAIYPLLLYYLFRLYSSLFLLSYFLNSLDLFHILFYNYFLIILLYPVLVFTTDSLLAILLLSVYILHMDLNLLSDVSHLVRVLDQGWSFLFTLLPDFTNLYNYYTLHNMYHSVSLSYTVSHTKILLAILILSFTQKNLLHMSLSTFLSLLSSFLNYYPRCYLLFYIYHNLLVILLVLYLEPSNIYSTHHTNLSSLNLAILYIFTPYHPLLSVF